MKKIEVIQKIQDDIKKHEARYHSLITTITTSENDRHNLTESALVSAEFALVYTIASKHEGMVDAYNKCLKLIEDME